MTSVDNRIVNMQFNNREFEKGIKESVKSLENLKKNLDLDNAAKSLNGLNTVASNFSLQGIAEGVDFLSNRFSTLGVIGMSMLHNLTTSAFNFARSMKTTVFDTIMEGGKRRALNIEQAKFQFEGLGMDVEQAMDDALYAVKGTAYGLDEAAKAASQLGATGVELGEDMKGALRGVSGVAAMTNSSYEDISRVFIAVAGNGRLMGQQLLSLSSKGINAAAVLAKSMGKSEQAVRKMVTAGEIDFETFYKAMDDAFGEQATKANETYAGSLSNVKAALSRLGAALKGPQLDNMRDVFNSLIPVIDNLFDSLKPLIDEFNEFHTAVTRNLIDGLSNINLDWLPLSLHAIKNVLIGLTTVMTPIKDAFLDIFPMASSERINNIAEAIMKFTEKLKMGEKNSGELRKTFKGLFAILDIGVMAFTAIANGVIDLLKVIFPAKNGLLEFTGGIGEFIVGVRDAIKETDIFNRTIKTITKFLKPFLKVIRDLIGGFGELDLAPVEDVADGIMKGFNPIKTLGKGIKTVFEGVIKALGQVGIFITGIVKATKNLATDIWEGITSAFRDGDSSELLNIINTGLFASIVIAIQELSKKLLDLNFGVRKVVFKITRVLDDVRISLQAWQTSLKAKTLMNIAIAMGILAGSLLLLASIDPKKLMTALGGMTVLFVELFGAMALFQTTTTKGAIGMTLMAVNMIAISTAILILSSAMKKLGDLDMEQISRGLVAVGGLLLMVIKTSEALSSQSGPMIRGAGSLVIFAAGIQILASAVKKLGEIDPDVLVRGLMGLGTMLVELGIFMRLSNFEGMGVSTGLGIIALSTALIILGKAVKTFGDMDTEALIKGLVGVGVVLGEIALFTKLTGNSKKVLSTSVGMIALGAAMVIFANAITTMGSMSWEELARGLIGMAGALGSITIAMNLLPKGMISKATGMVALSAALVLISKALTTMGGMSWDEVARGLITLAGSLTIITVSINLMTGALAGAAALVVIAGALALLSPVLVTFGGMDIASIGKALLMLAGVLVIFGGAGMLLGPLVPILLGLSGSIALFGLGALAAGTGVSALAVGIGALAGAFSVGGKSIISVAKELINLIPMILGKVGEGIVEIVKVLSDSIPKLVEALVKIVQGLLKAMRDLAPDLIDTIIDILSSLLSVIVEHTPEFVKAGMLIILGFLEGVADNISEVVQAGIDVIIGFIDGIGAKIEDVIQAGVDLIIAFVDGVSASIDKNTQPLLDSMGGLIESLLKAAVAIVTSPFKGAFSIGKDIVNGIIDGLTSMKEAAKNSMKSVGSTLLTSMKKALGIASPSKVFRTEVGQNMGLGILSGLEDTLPEINKQGAKVGSTTVESTAKAITKSSPKINKASKNAAKSAFDAAKEWIDKQRKYHDLSLEAELSKWKETLKYYKNGQDEYYEILKNIADTENRMRQQSFEHSKSWIAKEKELNRLSLFDELEAWERVQARYAEGTEQRKEADRGYASVRGEIIEKMKQIDQEYQQGSEEINAKLIEDMQAVTEAYEQAVEDRTNAIFRSFGLFDAVSMDEEVSGRDLIKNLQDQVNAVDLWASEFERLSKKGIDEGLLEELRNMGPKALPQLQALNKLTDRELSLYSDLWETKMFLARTQAEKELEGMKEDSKIKIEELRKQADKDLDVLKETWKTKTESITKTVVDEYKVMGDDIIESLRTLNNRSRTQFAQNNKDMKSVINNEDWNSLGKNIVEGVSSGVNNNSSSLIKAMVQLGRNAKKAMEDELGIQSPSKVFERIGQFTIEGLIEGLKDKKHMNVLSGVMNKITELIDGDMTLVPTIRPVLDMGEVTTGLNSAFSKEQLLHTRRSIQTANNIERTSRNEIPSTIDNTKQMTEINNEFVVHATIREEADVRKLSQELYSLQQQTSRGRGVR